MFFCKIQAQKLKTLAEFLSWPSQCFKSIYSPCSTSTNLAVVRYNEIAWDYCVITQTILLLYANLFQRHFCRKIENYLFQLFACKSSQERFSKYIGKRIVPDRLKDQLKILFLSRRCNFEDILPARAFSPERGLFIFFTLRLISANNTRVSWYNETVSDCHGAIDSFF